MSIVKFPTDTLHYIMCFDGGSAAWGGPFNPYSSTSSPRGFDASPAKLRIFKGALPSQNDIETTVPSSLRTSDVLITFATSNYWNITNGIASMASNISAAASASGTAAWFALTSYDTGLLEAGGTQYLVGEITLPGGGGELVINDLNIVSGTTYTLGSISFTLPSTYSYP